MAGDDVLLHFFLRGFMNAKSFNAMAIGIMVLMLCSCERAEEAPKASPPGALPQRIASVSPSATEMLFAIGVGDRVVGVTAFCDYPLEAKEREKVGSLGTPDLERLLKVNADLLVTTPMRRPEVAARIERFGIHICTVEQRTLADVYASIIKLGKITGAEQRANELAAEMKAREAEIAHLYKDIPVEKRPRVYLELGAAPLITGGRLSFVNDVIEKAGGRNIAASIEKDWIKVDPEFVLRENPDIIIIGSMAMEGIAREALAKRIGWSQIKAVREGRVIDDINPDYFLRPGPRIIEGLRMLAERFHPEERAREAAE